MKHFINHKDNSLILDIKIPGAENFLALSDLNQKWQRPLLGVDTSHGFLSAAFNTDTFERLAIKKEIVIGLFNERVVSYYLINSLSRDGVLVKHSDIVNGLKSKLILPSESKVALGAQALVDKDFQGSILRKLMLDELVKLNYDKYEYFFSTISKENLRAFNAHQKDGWQTISEDNETYHVILDLKEYLAVNAFQK